MKVNGYFEIAWGQNHLQFSNNFYTTFQVTFSIFRPKADIEISTEKKHIITNC